MTTTGARTVGEGTSEAEVLRLPQVTVHTLFVQLALKVVGQTGGRPKQMGASDGIAEMLTRVDDGDEDIPTWDADGNRDIVEERVEEDDEEGDIIGRDAGGDDEGGFVKGEIGLAEGVGDNKSVLFHCPLQTVPLEHEVEKLDQGLRSGIVVCSTKLEATKLGRKIAK